MSEFGDDLPEWEARLAAAEGELRERERAALQGEPTAELLRALAQERAKLASDRDAVADAYDEEARQRDTDATRRDVRGVRRDRESRADPGNADRAGVDRIVAGIDRDRAVGDRADAGDDRKRSALARRQAAADRQQAQDDADVARSKADDQGHEIASLRNALEARLVIGQAEGLLMAKHRISEDAAFALLTNLSQSAGLKLREVAQRLVDDELSSWGQEPPSSS